MADPRFDPAFQRGYDGPEPELVVRPGPPHAPEAAAAQRPGVDSAAEHPESAAGSASGVGHPDSHDERLPAARSNPYALALLVAGAAMLVAGGFLLQGYATTTVEQYTPETQALSTLQQTLAPALLVSGIAGVLAWLVLGALEAAARRP